MVSITFSLNPSVIFDRPHRTVSVTFMLLYRPILLNDFCTLAPWLYRVVVHSILSPSAIRHAHPAAR